MEACLLALFQYSCPKKSKTNVEVNILDYVKKIKSIQQLNWPWTIQAKSSGKKLVFEPMGDIHCIMTEIYYQAYLNSKSKSEFRYVVLDNCTVIDLKKMTCKSLDSDNYQEGLKVSRAVKSTQRKRRPSSIRHCSATNFMFSDEDQEHDAWLGREWLAINNKMTTLVQIQNGLVQESINRLNFFYSTYMDKYDMQKAEYNLKLVWRLFFQVAILDQDDMDIEIDQSVFRNANDNITKVLLYIHSMESFIPEALNLASSRRDQSKIENLGPYALALGCILDKAEVSRSDRSKSSFTVYKGLQLTDDEIAQFRDLENEHIDFAGFMSTNKREDFAITQARKNCGKNPLLQPVLVKILMKEPQGFYFSLNKREYSAYPDEQDIILYDGLYGRINKVEKVEKIDKPSSKLTITVIDMTYDPEDLEDEEDAHSMNSF